MFFLKFLCDIVDEKAQSGTVFRLMVDAIIGLIILMIILSFLGYFESLRVDVSKAEFFSIVKAATETPDGRVVSSNTLVFVKDTSFSANQLQALTNYSSECFEFQSIHGMLTISSDKKLAQVKQNIETKLFAKCVPSTSGNCVINCIISFGRVLEEGIN